MSSIQVKIEYKMNSEPKFSHVCECYFGMKVGDQDKNLHLMQSAEYADQT